jgi:hypothetical protein
LAIRTISLGTDIFPLRRLPQPPALTSVGVDEGLKHQSSIPPKDDQHLRSFTSKTTLKIATMHSPGFQLRGDFDRLENTDALPHGSIQGARDQRKDFAEIRLSEAQDILPKQDLRRAKTATIYWIALFYFVAIQTAAPIITVPDTLFPMPMFLLFLRISWAFCPSSACPTPTTTKIPRNVMDRITSCGA